MLKVYNLIKSKCFESEMIIGNGCQRNIDNSITLGCRTKEKRKRFWPNLIKTSWMDELERLMNIC